MTKILILFYLLTMSVAYSYCQLNIRGDNICLDEKALQVIQNEDKSISYELLTIKEINYPEITVKLAASGDERVVHIDDLSGNLTCEESSTVCKNQKVVIDADCIDSNKDQEHKVQNIYSNEMIEIKTGRIFFKKTRIIPVVCITNLQEYITN
jgi:hypothetical protein